MSSLRGHSVLDPLEAALRIAIIGFWATFVIGGAVGWGLAQVSTAPVGAILGAIMGFATVLWMSVTFKRSRGTLADPVRDKIKEI